ncbi:hypothetical protein TKK_0015383 [Trichogramma kaykai]
MKNLSLCILIIIFLRSSVLSVSSEDADPRLDKKYTRTGFNLYEAVSQFFKLFPQLENNIFYVSGESYVGKFVTALAYSVKL